MIGATTRRALERGWRVQVWQHRDELISQNWAQCARMGVPDAWLGVIRGSDPRRNPGAKVQLVSVPTLAQRVARGALPPVHVILVDEAHRTQYGFEARLKSRKVKDGASPAVAYATGDGQTVASTADFAPPEYQVKYQAGYAQHLRDALPHATFVAFTGTPVSSTDRDTRAVFGDYIHVYDMQQAKEDGATVAIYFESRLAKLSLKQEELPQIDDEVDELAEDPEAAAVAWVPQNATRSFVADTARGELLAQVAQQRLHARIKRQVGGRRHAVYQHQALDGLRGRAGGILGRERSRERGRRLGSGPASDERGSGPARREGHRCCDAQRFGPQRTGYVGDRLGDLLSGSAQESGHRQDLPDKEVGCADDQRAPHPPLQPQQDAPAELPGASRCKDRHHFDGRQNSGVGIQTRKPHADRCTHAIRLDDGAREQAAL